MSVAPGIRRRRGATCELSTACVCAAALWIAANAASARPALRTRSTDMIELIETDENIARLRSVGWTKDAGRVQLINDACRAPIADLEPALQQRRRTLLVLNDYLGRLTEQLVAVAVVSGLAIGLASFQ